MRKCNHGTEAYWRAVVTKPGICAKHGGTASKGSGAFSRSWCLGPFPIETPRRPPSHAGRDWDTPRACVQHPRQRWRNRPEPRERPSPRLFDGAENIDATTAAVEVNGRCVPWPTRTRLAAFFLKNASLKANSHSRLPVWHGVPHFGDTFMAAYLLTNCLPIFRRGLRTSTCARLFNRGLSGRTTSDDKGGT